MIDLAEYIRRAAQIRGIDPDVALKVARSEGLAPGVWQSNVMSSGRREPSYGPFQLLVGGPGTGYGTGLGNKFIETTGLDPRDQSTAKAQIDFALDEARAGGWGPWMGAKKLGITGFHGIDRDAPGMAMRASYTGQPDPELQQALEVAAKGRNTQGDMWRDKTPTGYGPTSPFSGILADAPNLEGMAFDPQLGFRGSPERPSVPFSPAFLPASGNKTPNQRINEAFEDAGVTGTEGETTMATYEPTGVLAGQPAKPNRFREFLGDNRGFLLGLGAELLAHGIDTRNPVTGTGIMAGANADERRQDRRADRDREYRGENATLRMLMQRGYSEADAMDLIHSGLAIKALSPGFEASKLLSPEEEAQQMRLRQAGATKIDIGSSKGQVEVDKKYAPDYVEWTTGGAADAAKQLAQLKRVASVLESGNNRLTGPLVGSFPDLFNAAFNPEAISTREAVEEVVQRNLRAILGAQFTKEEGERLIARAYNPRLDEKENARRLRRLVAQVEAAFEAKQAAARYFAQNGTLVGWQGRIPAVGDFMFDDEDGSSGDPLGIR